MTSGRCSDSYRPWSLCSWSACSPAVLRWRSAGSPIRGISAPVDQNSLDKPFGQPARIPQRDVEGRCQVLDSATGAALRILSAASHAATSHLSHPQRAGRAAAPGDPRLIRDDRPIGLVVLGIRRAADTVGT
jgi:hypothetical protein